MNEQQQESASLYVLGALNPEEHSAFEEELRQSRELRDLVRSLQRTTGLLATALPAVKPPTELRQKILARTNSPGTRAAPARQPGEGPALRFVPAADRQGWKELPVRGAWIKLLSLDRERGYAVVLGKLEPGVRYPPHLNFGPEDLCILTGDLHIGGRRLGPGDFHHADAGSYHDVNHSEAGCTLIAVLTADNPLVALAGG